MNTILFDDSRWESLLPLTFTKPVSYLRTGILTFKERWEKSLKHKVSCLSKDYLAEKFPVCTEDVNLLINSGVFPESGLMKEIKKLRINEVLISDNVVLAAVLEKRDILKLSRSNLDGLTIKNTSPVLQIRNTWDLFKINGDAIKFDYKLLTRARKSEKISKTNRLVNAKNIFIEKGAKVEFAVINAEAGPVYIGKEAEIMEGSLIRGPFALCEHAVVKMGAKIYGPTTIGPHSKVGGEINNSVISAYSNKAHDGFLGNSVLGEWCNLGADTNNSNLKNNYAEVKLWSYESERFEKTGLQFCGLIMGDHSKCGINTMFNTGTVVGICSNLFGDGFMRNFIPSFSWGGASGFTVFTLPKVFEVASIVMARREINLDEADKKIIAQVFDATKKYRQF